MQKTDCGRTDKRDITAYLKVLDQFDFSAILISNYFCKKTNLPNIHCNMLARLYVVSVKS